MIAKNDFGCQIFAVGARKPQRTTLGRVIDHMDDQAHVAVDEVLPRPRLVV